MTARQIKNALAVTDHNPAQLRERRRRTPPKASNSFRLAFLYRVGRETGFASTTYHLQRISRKPTRIKNRSGLFVRYDGGWWRLYSPPELQHLLHEAKQASDTVLVDNQLYDPALHPCRAFFLCWDNPIEGPGVDA